MNHIQFQNLFDIYKNFKEYEIQLCKVRMFQALKLCCNAYWNNKQSIDTKRIL